MAFCRLLYVKSLGLGLMAPVFRAARSPELFFGSMPENVKRFNRVFAVEVSSLSDHAMLVRHRYLLPVDEYGAARACEFTSGAYATVPTMYGGPLATVKEVLCVNRGDPHCEYMVSWKKQKGLLGTLLSNVRQDDALLAETTSALAAAMERLEQRGQELEGQRLHEQHLREQFQQYVPRQVVERVLGQLPDHEAGTGGERRVVTALLADIREFVSYTQAHSPEQVVETLNRFFSMASEVIEDQRGTIDKLIGDAMLAVFGAPCSHGNDADRAVQAAVRIRDAMPAFNREQERLGLRPLKVGICLATGTGIAGNIGSELRWDYTVIGAPINLAARLQDLAKGHGDVVLMDEATRAALHGPVDARLIREARVRGLDRPVPVHLVEAHDERRRFLRYPVDAPVFTAEASGTLLDISLGGAAMRLQAALEPGHQRLAIGLHQREYSCEIWPVWCRPDGEHVLQGVAFGGLDAAFELQLEALAAAAAAPGEES